MRPDQHTATPAVAEGAGGRCAGSSPAPARRGGRDATDAPGSPPPAPTAAGEWTPWTRRDHTPAPHDAGEWDAMNVPDHHHQRPPWGNVTPWTRWITLPPAPAAVGRKNGRVYARLFYLLVKNQCIIFCHLMPLKFLLRTIIYFYHFCSRHRIRAMFRI